MSLVNEYTFFLDSKYRSESENASPTFKLDSPIVLENINNYFVCKVVSCDIPFSFKALASPYNVIPVRFEVIQHSIDILGNITIPEGNYSILSLLSELQTRLTAFMVGSGFNQIPSLDFSYDSDTGKCTLNIIPAGGSHTVFLTLKWENADIIAEYFGFSYLANTVLSFNLSTITSTNFVSPNNVNVSPITSLYIRSNSLNQTAKNQERLVEQAFSVSDILLKVPVNSYYNTWLMYENDSFSVRLNNKHIEVLSLYITSQTYDKVVFNGVHWKIVLKILEYEPEYMSYIRQQQMIQVNQITELTSQKNELLKQLEQIKTELVGLAKPN